MTKRPTTIDRQAEIVGQRVERRIQNERAGQVTHLVEWAREAREEISAFHDLAYPTCRGNCPTHYLLDGLRLALLPFNEITTRARR